MRSLISALSGQILVCTAVLLSLCGNGGAEPPLTVLRFEESTRQVVVSNRRSSQANVTRRGKATTEVRLVIPPEKLALVGPGTSVALTSEVYGVQYANPRSYSSGDVPYVLSPEFQSRPDEWTYETYAILDGKQLLQERATIALDREQLTLTVRIEEWTRAVHGETGWVGPLDGRYTNLLNDEGAALEGKYHRVELAITLSDQTTGLYHNAYTRTFYVSGSSRLAPPKGPVLSYWTNVRLKVRLKRPVWPAAEYDAP